jgi:hypothetical protein
VLEFNFKVEYGPSQTLKLQWASYRDAGDQCGLSRLYGGVHVPQDDINVLWNLDLANKLGKGDRRTRR